jgi:hypothetical protein
MHNFGILLKSYDGDFDLAERLIESFNKYNPESLPMFILVPEADVHRFNRFASDTITVLSESLLGEHLVEHEVAGIRPGYINQEIVKLSFWELGLTENYFCVDSDAVFIRPLTRDDFMYDEHTPYTVLVEDNELKVEPKYYAEHWQGREIALRRIQQEVGLNDRRLLTCHGHQVFSSVVLRSLKEEFLASRNWSYADMLEVSPYEFTWYNMWLQRTRVIPIEIREPLIKTFHHQGQALEYNFRSVKPGDVARGFVGIVVNSNYARSSSASVDAETAASLSRQLTISQLLSALSYRIRDRFRSRSARTL